MPSDVSGNFQSRKGAFDRRGTLDSVTLINRIELFGITKQKMFSGGSFQGSIIYFFIISNTFTKFRLTSAFSLGNALTLDVS